MADDDKAEDIVVLDMRKAVNFCDYFVICTASSGRRIRGIADNISDELSKLGIKLKDAKSFDDSTWVLLDSGDVVVHIFDASMREFYGLEHLWQAAPRINWKK